MKCPSAIDHDPTVKILPRTCNAPAHGCLERMPSARSRSLRAASSRPGPRSARPAPRRCVSFHPPLRTRSPRPPPSARTRSLARFSGLTTNLRPSPVVTASFTPETGPSSDKTNDPSKAVVAVEKAFHGASAQTHRDERKKNSLLPDLAGPVRSSRLARSRRGWGFPGCQRAPPR